MCHACHATINPQTVDAFAGKLINMLNHAATAMMLSLGHRTGLLDTMAEMSPSTSHEIAAQSSLDERYVREWLAAMVASQIVTYHPESRTYHLPTAHAALLTRAATPDNLATTMQWVAVLAGVEDKLVDCFQNGGGVPYSAYPRFHEVMSEESGQTVVAPLIQHLLPLVDGLVDKLTSGIQVLDVGCGSGHAMIALAQVFPQSQFSGYDMSEEAIATAQAETNHLGLTNIYFQVKNVAKLGEHDAYDLITAFDAIHDQADPAGVLAAIAQALRKDGTFLMQDIKASSHVEQNMDNPIAPFLYTISCMHCMTVSLAQGGAGLGSCWGKELACDMLAAAGFQHVDVKTLDHDIMNYYYVARR